jgi:hypothetical protein
VSIGLLGPLQVVVDGAPVVGCSPVDLAARRIQALIVFSSSTSRCDVQTSSRSASPGRRLSRSRPGRTAAVAQLVHHRSDDPAAARADRMAERDGAAVHVHDRLVCMSMRVELSATDENASLISTRSTSLIDLFAFSSAR